MAGFGYLLVTSPRHESKDIATKSKKQRLTLSAGPLAMTEALSKLLIVKGIITEDEFKTQLQAERANYLAVLKRLHGLAFEGESTSLQSTLTV
jgi:hypothetical protein